MKASKRNPMNVLLAFDGSEHSRAATLMLGDLCTRKTDRRQSKITLLSVITPRQTADHASIREALNQAANKLQNECFQVTQELILGYPAEKIVEISEQIKPDLILIGAKGLRATLGILLGGVAQQVVEYACCPVLVVRAPYRKIKSVLLVVDGSQYSENATRYLMDFPLPAQVQLRVMHVLPPIPIRPAPDLIAQTWPIGPEIITPPPAIVTYTEDETNWQQQEEEQGKLLLENTLESIKNHGLEASSVLKRGDAASEIIEFTRTNEVDLIVAGSRGLSQVRGWLLGSVSRKLVHYSDCSVLLVKTPPEK